MPPSDGSHSQSKPKTISCEPLPRRRAETPVDTTEASFMSQTYPPLVPEGNHSCGKISPSETTPLPSPASYKWTPVSDRISLKISSSNLRSSQHSSAIKNTCGEYHNPSMSSRCTHIMKLQEEQLTGLSKAIDISIVPENKITGARNQGR